MNAMIRFKLSVMFFLEYVIWGAWLPLLGLYLGNSYLNFTGGQQAWTFNAFAIASLTGMFFGGQLADRYFSQEKFLAFSHLIGGRAMFGLAYVRGFWPFFGLMLLHCFFYVPTLSVTNAIAFANLKDAQKEFGFVRLWGTIGWIAASWPFIFIPIDWARVPAMAEGGGVVAWLGKALSTLKTGPAMEAALTSTFIVSGVASLALAAFCFFLPHTPPAKDEGSAFAPFEAIRLLAIPSILVLFIVTFFDSLVHYCYFFWTSRYLATLGLPENWIAPAMSIGQVMEIVAMATLGLFLKALGWRRTMIIGILGQGVRFLIYMFGTPQLLWLVIASNLVHGFAYACFFATVYIFVDENFPKDVRTSAQGLFNLLILGLGPFLGNFLWGWLGDAFTRTQVVGGQTVKVIDFHQLFLVPLGFSLFAAALLAIFFHPERKEPAPAADPALV
jgi:nucleoside transporter